MIKRNTKPKKEKIKMPIKIGDKIFGFANLGRHRPYITITQGNEVKVYGQFRNTEMANEFFDLLYDSIEDAINRGIERGRK